VEVTQDKFMAHFAKLGVGNIVERVEVVSNDIATTEQAGVDFLNNLYKTRDVWKQTSYNNNIRKNYAGIGCKYDQTRDAFIPPKPFNSWILNEDTCLWESPVAYPNDGQRYIWNEQNQTWDLINNI
jgi:hypothetical protein